ncbi:MAG: excinuclease ABC subunit UvrA [Phycisphaerales bacterium]|nr:excinuclease ABC subunit UvrA [Phycisphaerales bacterium]
MPDDPSKCIRVRGAREHNLKGIDVDIPRDKLVVITGLSGSGKSSLAFDTIFAEGQRKYMESLSAYARQFLDQLKKPDVDDVEGLPPTIAIEQRSGVANPRSTVATTTEIYDYLRLLFARCGRPCCWAPTRTRKDGTVLERCGKPIESTSASQIVEAVMSSIGTPAPRVMILAPVVRAKKGFHKDVLEDAQSKGWGRIRVAPGGRNPQVFEIREALKKGGENPLDLARHEKHTLDIVIDRIVPAAESRQRLAESVEASLRAAEGTVIISIEELREDGTPAWVDRVFSEKHACSVHPECSLAELSPRVFSFNSPQGACPECHGLGAIMEFDADLCIPDKSKTLAQGAIKPWKVPPPMGRFFRRRIKFFCESFGVSPNTPVERIPKRLVKILLHGADAEEQEEFGAKFDGVGASLRAWFEKTESSFMREWLGQFMREKTCPACRGDRLRIETLSVVVASDHAANLRGRESVVASLGGAPRGPREIPLNIADLAGLTILDAVDYLKGLKLTSEHRVIAEPILKEVLSRLGFLTSVGLEYLSLDRKTGTLSGGEAQRIRLATQVGSKLVGACYVLDEPTIGLHQRDNTRLISTLRHLADIGNSVLVVEHDEEMIRAADHVLDVGPGPGVHGGRIVAQGTIPEIIAEPGSLTGQYLSHRRRIETSRTRRPLDPARRAIVIKGARENNLKNIDAAFPVGGGSTGAKGSGGLICVTGVSGSGKSTLVNDILLKAARHALSGGGSRDLPGQHGRITGLAPARGGTGIDRVIEVDQSPIGRTPRSNPATYTGVFGDIRNIFATTKEAKIRGYTPGRFSFNVRAQKGGGRCEACEGQGLKKIEMHFLPDVYVACEVCGGSRYNRETLEVTFRGKSIAQVLRMTIEQACEFFQNHPKIARFVECLRDVGLGYIELGQPSTTLSGGEAQRVKLATELGKTRGFGGPARGDDPSTDDNDSDEPGDSDERPRSIRADSPYGSTLYILDEPTTGLHFDDVNRLIQVLNRLADAGNTLVVIEHNLDVIKCADWIIDLGPEGGDAGGTIVAAGTPEQVARNEKSHTGKYLREILAHATH